MAKKSKKRKQKRHQLKKSKRGQSRKRQPRKLDAVSPKHSDDGILSQQGPVSMVTVSRDVPVAQDGYRIVGPAQAMMDYARPLIDESSSDEEINKYVTFAQLCWNLAIFEREQPRKFERQKRKLASKFGAPDAESTIDMMIERFHLMFPDLGESPSFYIKERVIDIEEYEPFDESALHISKDRIPPTKEELKLAEALREIDPSEDEAEMSEWQDEVVGCYAEWCIAKGVSDDKVEHFAFAVNSYLNFLSGYYGEVPSNDTPTGAVREFMRTFFIRKTWAEAQEKSMMPCALKLFMQYLDEKGIVKSTQRLRKLIESEQDNFLRNLVIYTDPSLGGKVITLNKRRHER
jgi:hypothetical protein